MRYTNYFIPTYKEIPCRGGSDQPPVDASCRHDQETDFRGLHLPAHRAQVPQESGKNYREEMESIRRHRGASLPCTGQNSGKRAAAGTNYGAELLRFRDRNNHEGVPGGPPTRRSSPISCRREIHSYKQLPVNFYQIQFKFRMRSGRGRVMLPESS